MKQTFHKLKNFPFQSKGNTFYKFFLIIFFCCSFSVSIISWISYRYTSKHIIKQVSNSNISMLTEKQIILEQKFTEIDNVIHQLINNQDIWKLVISNEINVSDYLQMRSISKLLTDTTSSNKLIDSIYIFTDQLDFVLTNAKYDKNNFFDQEILSLDFKENIYIMPPRYVNNQKVVSYVKKFAPLQKNQNVYMVANINFDHLFENMMVHNDEYHLDILIFNDQCMEIFPFPHEQSVLEWNQKRISQICQAEKSQESYQFDNFNNVFWKKSSNTLNWTLVFLQSYSDLIQSTHLVKKIMKTSFLIVLFISLVLAYILSLYLYQPVAQLNTKIKKLPNGNTFYLNKKNEYEAIDDAVNNLFCQNNELTSKYNFIFPSFRQYSIRYAMSDTGFNKEYFNHTLDLLGVHFCYQQYCIVFIDFENTPFTVSLKESLDTFLSDYHTIQYTLNTMQNSRILIIMNTNENIDSIYEILKSLKEMLNMKTIQLTISLSPLFDELENMPNYYHYALEQLQHKFFIGKNEIIYNMKPQSVNKNIFYPKDLEEKMLNYIQNQNKTDACETLQSLIENIVKNPQDIEYVKYIFFQICSNIVYLLVDLGLDVEKEGFSTENIFTEIQSSHTLQDIKKFVIHLITKSIALVSEIKNVEHSNIVKKTIDFLHDNFTKNLSLEEIASSVFLSPNYLSTIFKSETGTTIFDYITDLRMEYAKELLIKDSNIKIQDIAIKVGYNNVQSFIRFFKKYYHMTPIQYRRKMITND